MTVSSNYDAAVKAGVEHWLARAEAKTQASPEEHVRALLAAAMPELRTALAEEAAQKIIDWAEDSLGEDWEEAYTAALDCANIVRRWADR